VEPLGAVIRRRRLELGHGLRSFSAQVNVSPSHLSRIEREINGAQPEVMMRIAIALNMRIQDVTREPERDS
jgi:transcriptional regulator with XRE-family HTH domain